MLAFLLKGGIQRPRTLWCLWWTLDNGTRWERYSDTWLLKPSFKFLKIVRGWVWMAGFGMVLKACDSLPYYIFLPPFFTWILQWSFPWLPNIAFSAILSHTMIGIKNRIWLKNRWKKGKIWIEPTIISVVFHM